MYEAVNQIQAAQGKIAERSLSVMQEKAQILAKEFEAIWAVTHDLEHKMQAFMLPDTVAVKEASVATPEAPHSPMWHEMDMAINKLSELRMRIGRICSRIES